MTQGITPLKALLHERLAGRQTQSLVDRRASVDAIASFGNRQGTAELHYVQLAGVKTAIFSSAPAKFNAGKLTECIFYIHGGAFVAGSARSHSSICWSLHEATGCPVIAPEYSLAPEHCHPTARIEIASIIEAIVAANARPVQYSLVGDSAGATLALLCASELRRQGGQMPESLVLISPLTDLYCSGDSYEERQGLDPFISRDGLLLDIRSYAGPLGVTPSSIMAEFADLSGLPPILVQVGLHEVLLDDARAFAVAAEAVGVNVQLEIWPEMIHVWHLFPDFLEQSKRAIKNIALFLRR